jgi:hypothetical protein
MKTRFDILINDNIWENDGVTTNFYIVTDTHKEDDDCPHTINNEFDYSKIFGENQWSYSSKTLQIWTTSIGIKNFKRHFRNKKLQRILCNTTQV